MSSIFENVQVGGIADTLYASIILHAFNYTALVCSWSTLLDSCQKPKLPRNQQSHCKRLTFFWMVRHHLRLSPVLGYWTQISSMWSLRTGMCKYTPGTRYRKSPEPKQWQRHSSKARSMVETRSRRSNLALQRHPLHMISIDWYRRQWGTWWMLWIPIRHIVQ